MVRYWWRPSVGLCLVNSLSDYWYMCSNVSVSRESVKRIYNLTMILCTALVSLITLILYSIWLDRTLKDHLDYETGCTSSAAGLNVIETSKSFLQPLKQVWKVIGATSLQFVDSQWVDALTFPALQITFSAHGCIDWGNLKWNLLWEGTRLGITWNYRTAAGPELNWFKELQTKLDHLLAV